MAPFSFLFPRPLFHRQTWLAGLAAVLLSAAAQAEKVQIEFLPPPMEGTLSLGIYNAQGKLVRTLHEEATLDAFTIALNGLITYWDGKDDQGAELPSGRYTARGYRVGEFKVEGVGFSGNDWIDHPDEPRLRRIERIAALSDRELLIEGKVPGRDDSLLFLATPEQAAPAQPAPEAAPAPAAEAARSDWTLAPAPEGTLFPASTAAAHPGPSPTVIWLLQGSTLLQLINGESGHTIEVQNSEDPSPTQLALSPSAHALFVLDENDSLQRLWGLLFPQPAAAPDEAEALFIKTIHFSHTLAAAADLLKFSDGKPVDIVETHPVQPIHNPLLKAKKPPRITLRASFDKGGSYLATTDGLILDRISETPHLLWAALGRASKKDSEIIVYESDGAAIAEFRVSGLDRIMSFNAGDFEWKASKTKPKPQPTATPEPEPESKPPAATPAPSAETTPEPEIEEEEPVEAFEEAAELPAPQPAPTATPEATPPPQTPQTP
ncbi:MAG TPA: FlgD immunoglobulin-like domain containing protein [Chthoniobacteraceae bacterium]|nr:FlgD immunoglobulin-like domain containing protein [Chthoniobacteraceae bacterium]